MVDFTSHYDATGSLETLTLNESFIAFWYNKLNSLCIEAIRFYEQPIKVGILHLTPELGANEVN